MAVEGQRFMTKTQHYRKVTKPLLERKRRARMNLYLDELKDLIVDTMEAQGEHVTKLEKADILEMTVNYLKVHKHEIAARTQSINGTTTTATDAMDVEKFKAGYTQAAYEVSKVFATLPGIDLKFGTRLLKHLGYQMKDIKVSADNEQKQQPTVRPDVEFVRPSSHNSLPLRKRVVVVNKNENSMDFMQEQQAEQPAKGDDVWRPW